MRSLRDLQQEFGRSLLEPGGAATRSRLQIYVNNVYGNWTKALASAYPIVRKIVGASFFESLATAYARAHLSRSGDLNEFGAQLSSFLSRFSHTRDLPYLPDVARMEWLAHRAYFAADAPPFNSARLTGIAAQGYGSLRLRCAPGTALISSQWPLARIWEVHQDGYLGELTAVFDAARGRFLIFRPRWRVMVESISQGDHRFLAEARRGATLEEALAAASAADRQFDVANALARWVGKGAVAL